MRPLLQPGSIFPSTARWCGSLSTQPSIAPAPISFHRYQAKPLPAHSWFFPWSFPGIPATAALHTVCFSEDSNSHRWCQAWTEEAGTGRGARGLLHSLPGGRGGSQPEMCVAHLLQNSLLVTWKNIPAQGMPLQGQWSRHLEDMKE